jgi:hypothetical protein
MNRNAIFVAIALVLGAGEARAQDSLNVERLGSIQMSAYQVAVSGNYAYVAAGDSGLRVVNVSDPTQPREVGHCDLRYPALDVQIGSEWVFVWIESLPQNGLSVIDFSDPADPREVGYYTLPAFGFRARTNARFAVNGNLAVVCDTSNNHGTAHFIDFADPANPTVVGIFDGGWGWAVAMNGNLFCYGRMGWLGIVDISDAANSFEAGHIGGDMDVTSIALRDSIMIAALEGGGAIVFDVSEPASPLSVGGLFPGDGFANLDTRITFNSNIALTTLGGLTVADISDPRNPYDIGYYHASRPNIGFALGDNGLIYAVDSTSLGIYRFTPPNAVRPAVTPVLPKEFSLASPYPNPFNSTVRLSFALPGAGYARLTLDDLSGREVARLADGQFGAGEHSFSYSAGGLPSGVYLIHGQFGGSTRMERVILLK